MHLKIEDLAIDDLVIDIDAGLGIFVGGELSVLLAGLHGLGRLTADGGGCGFDVRCQELRDVLLLLLRSIFSPATALLSEIIKPFEGVCRDPMQS